MLWTTVPFGNGMTANHVGLEKDGLLPWQHEIWPTIVKFCRIVRQGLQLVSPREGTVGNPLTMSLIILGLFLLIRLYHRCPII